MDKTQNYLPTGTILHGKSYNYRIEKILGQGSFGITYLASVRMVGALGTIDANIKVAIKEFFMKEINGREGFTVTSGSKGGLFENYRRMFVREATNLSKLQHPNIIKVLENFESNGTSYYVMEYIDGTNLNEFIATHMGMSEYDALSYVLKIAQAVDFMHQNKMLHLDIKPLNIMRKNTGEVILIDFGLSKQFNEDGEPESSTRIGGGTMGYAPLEQHTYKKGQGFPATLDIYALGATLYKCITSKTPPEATVILNEGFPEGDLKACEASEEVIHLIENAMRPIVKGRIQTAAELIVMIQRALPHANIKHVCSSEQTIVDEDKCRKNTIPCHTDFFGKEAMDDDMKNVVNEFISNMRVCRSGCKVGNVPFTLYDTIMETGKRRFGPTMLRIYDILQFIDKLQLLTGLHWRLPDYEELADSWDSRSGMPGIRNELYYNAADVSLYKHPKFGGESERLTSYDFHFELYECTLVLDPLQADFYQTREYIDYYGIQSTRAIADEKGLWHFGLCPIKYENQWAVVDKYGNHVLGFQFDTEPQIGFMHYACGGPLLMECLRIKYQKDNKIGYYRVLPNNKLEWEIECTPEEWKERECWT